MKPAKMTKSKPRFNRAAIMRDAHKRFRDSNRLGLGFTFRRCLSTAWEAARQRATWDQQRRELYDSRLLAA